MCQIWMAANSGKSGREWVPLCMCRGVFLLLFSPFSWGWVGSVTWSRRSADKNAPFFFLGVGLVVKRMYLILLIWPTSLMGTFLYKVKIETFSLEKFSLLSLTFFDNIWSHIVSRCLATQVLLEQLWSLGTHGDSEMIYNMIYYPHSYIIYCRGVGHSSPQLWNSWDHTDPNLTFATHNYFFSFFNLGPWRVFGDAFSSLSDPF